MAKTKIGNYKIIGLIGEGGMGKIYKAIDPRSKKTIIIKELLISSKTTITKRFQREASIMATFSHPNIVKVFKHFNINNTYYIAMEYVDGLSLGELIKKRKIIPPMVSMLIFYQICKGLKYAHDKGVIHRDIKPDNVLISRKGHVKLCDFGIATAQPGKDEELTKTGVIMGTPAYMSPEQLISTKYVDIRSDIYSMGIVFYQMITGTKPFPGSFTTDTISKISKGNYVKPEKINSDIPSFFKLIIKKTMNCKTEKRFDSLQRILDVFAKYTDLFSSDEQLNGIIKEFLSGKEIRFCSPNKLKKSLVKKKAPAAKKTAKSKSVRKSPAKKPVSRKPAAKKTPVKKASKKIQSKKTPAKKSASKKKTTKKAPLKKKTSSKKTSSKKPAAKKPVKKKL